MIEFLCGTIIGIIVGAATPYLYSMYRNYISHDNINKFILKQAISIYIDDVFDCLYNNDIELFDTHEFMELCTKIISILPKYNKLFKITYENNMFVVNIIDNNIFSDNNFINVLKYFEDKKIGFVVSYEEISSNKIPFNNMLKHE